MTDTVTVLRAGALAVVVALFGAGLVLMTREQFPFAGLSFLGASVLIYLRESRL
ncbi:MULTISPECIES: hypothetical protein [Halarchaeum]|uniref:Uncharacterized protein n=1 Tax=Halarchaeum nitratireducens TaxID=489913 RepID=A0A830GC77_9EURY|nr:MULTISPECIES: hypothetical protein [Halarchaeum]MBP2252387.1 hypothetical protein [Halarchaeum solikamskense]QLC35356.1 hypothetical protein EFA46_013940 [Halarchaeum sp. CBA1220]GGN20450.1 hypothetical protein GCM10009021_21960 [Halarchaeum nitratireducens]